MVLEKENIQGEVSAEQLEMKEGEFDIEKESLTWDIAYIDPKGMGEEVIKNPKKHMERDIWVWWESLCEAIEGKKNWESFKEEARKKYKDEEIIKFEGMPYIMQNLHESTKEWVNRVESLGSSLGISPKEIKKSMMMGIASPRVKREVLMTNTKNQSVEELKDYIIQTEYEYKQTRKNEHMKRMNDGKGPQCYRCAKFGHIEKHCKEVH